MKKLIVIILCLLLLVGCSNVEPIAPTETEFTPTFTIDTQSPTGGNTEIITGEEFEARYGIAVGYNFNLNTNTFSIHLLWTNKFNYATSFHGNYIIEVYQKNIKLSDDKTDQSTVEAINMEMNPGAKMLVEFNYTMIDAAAPIYLIISDMETEFHYDPFYPDAVG